MRTLVDEVHATGYLCKEALYDDYRYRRGSPWATAVPGSEFAQVGAKQKKKKTRKRKTRKE
jgi:hypothetical protein